MDESRIILKSIENTSIKIQATACGLSKVVTYEKEKIKNTTCYYKSILLKNITVLSTDEQLQLDHVWINQDDFIDKDMFNQLKQLVASQNCVIALTGIVRKYTKYPSYDYYKHITYYSVDYRISDITTLEILSTKERPQKNIKSKKTNFTGYYVCKNGKTLLNNKIIYHYGKKIKCKASKNI